MRNGIASILIAIFIGILLIGAGVLLRRNRYASPENTPAPSAPEESSATSSPAKTDVLGFIRALRENHAVTLMDFDDAQFLVGDAANKAMVEDGKCYMNDAAGRCVAPNDYYIRNIDHATTSIGIAPDARIMLATTCPLYPEIIPPDHMSVSLATFSRIYQDPRCSWTKVPYWITTNSSGAITEIKEQYIP